MSNKILLYLVMIAVTDTIKDWLWRPCEYLICAVRKPPEEANRKERR